MSTTDSTARVASPENGSPYAAGDWWGGGDGGDDRDDGDQEETLDPNDPDLYIAHAIRKGRHGVVCGWSYQYGEMLELSEPCVYIGDTAGEMRHAKRYNPDGAMNWGEGTWTRIPDGTLDELLADLELWFEMSDRRLTERERKTLSELAKRQKQQQHQNDLTDTEIMANVVDEVRSPGGISA